MGRIHKRSSSPGPPPPPPEEAKDAAQRRESLASVLPAEASTTGSKKGTFPASNSCRLCILQVLRGHDDFSGLLMPKQGR